MVNTVTKEQSFNLAMHHHPEIYQLYKDPLYDGLTSIQLGDKKNIIKNLNKLIIDPVLYYGVKEDETYYYIFYMLYHPFDWAQCKINFIKNLLSHRHDTEAILIRTHKENKECDLVTVYHKSFKFAKKVEFPVKILINSCSHAISPLKTLKKDNYLFYNNIENLEDINEWDNKYWDECKKELNKEGALMPDQMHDTFLYLSCISDRRDEYKHKLGDIWNRPDCLFLQAHRKNLI